MAEIDGVRLTHAASLRERALEVIRHAIVSGEMQPGEIHSATALASQLGVSPSPVREAMLALTDEGILEPIRNRGFRVVPLTEDDLREIYELRVMLEVPAVVALANRDLSPHMTELNELATANEEAAHSGDIGPFLETDREFHLRMLSIGGNRRLVELVGLLRDKTRLYGIPTLAAQGLLAGSASEHRSILEAINAGDSDVVRNLMTHHLSHITGEWSSREFQSRTP